MLVVMNLNKHKGTALSLRLGTIDIANSMTAAVSTPSDSITCNGCYNEVFENTSCLCISDMLQLLENCCPHNFTSMLETHNQYLCKYIYYEHTNACVFIPLWLFVLYFSMQV